MQKLIFNFILLAIFPLLVLGADVQVSSEAKIKENMYVQLELPIDWECKLQEINYVCHSKRADMSEAIIVISAKLREEKDSIDDYSAYLKKKSLITHVTPINGYQWVDALYLGSELPNFYTRYLVTVREDLGIIFSFSVAKDKYPAYLSMIEKAVFSLKTKSGLGNKNPLLLQSNNVSLFDMHKKPYAAYLSRIKATRRENQ